MGNCIGVYFVVAVIGSEKKASGFFFFNLSEFGELKSNVVIVALASLAPR